MWRIEALTKFPSRYDLMAGLALVIVMGGPVWAEDQNQVPPDFVPGVEIIQSSPLQPLDAVDPFRLRDMYGEDKVYVDTQTGQATVYKTQDGNVVSKEAWGEYMRGIGEKHKTDTRQWVNEAIGAEKAGYRKFGESGDLEVNVHDDVRVNDVVNATLSEQQKLEKMIDDGQAQIDAEVKRVVPLKSLRSFEAGYQDSKQQ